MKVDHAQLVVRLVEIRIQFQRTPVRLNNRFVRKAVGVCPKNHTASKMALGEIRIQRKSFLDRDCGILVQLFLFHVRSRKVERFNVVGARQCGPSESKLRIDGYHLFQ